MNRESVLEKQKAYVRALPPEVRRERIRRSQETHKEKARQRYFRQRKSHPWRNSIQGSKQRAKKEGISFTLTEDWAQARWTGRCEVTGIEFVLSTGRHPYLFSPSLDRVIPALGYTPDNSRFVIHAVNALKGAGTDQDMLRIAKAILTPELP